MEKLDGHEKGCCSSVSWNPTNPQMFASGGDDCKVRMCVPSTPSKPLLLTATDGQVKIHKRRKALDNPTGLENPTAAQNFHIKRVIQHSVGR